MQRYPLKLFFKDYFILTGILGAFLADIFLWIYVPLRARNFGDLAFLHYTIHFGVDFIGGWTRFLLLPVLGLIILAVHTGLGYCLYSTQKELARFMILSQAVLCGFLIMSAVVLFIIN